MNLKTFKLVGKKNSLVLDENFLYLLEKILITKSR